MRPRSEPFYRATAAEPSGLVRRRHVATPCADRDRSRGRRARHRRTRRGGAVPIAGRRCAHGISRRSPHGPDGRHRRHRSSRSRIGSSVATSPAPSSSRAVRARGRRPSRSTARPTSSIGTETAIAKSGVLLIGPSPVFLRYIERVLPSLGETGAVLAHTGPAHARCGHLPARRGRHCRRQGRPPDGRRRAQDGALLPAGPDRGSASGSRTVCGHSAAIGRADSTRARTTDRRQPQCRSYRLRPGPAQITRGGTGPGTGSRQRRRAPS